MEKKEEEKNTMKIAGISNFILILGVVVMEVLAYKFRKIFMETDLRRTRSYLAIRQYDILCINFMQKSE